MIIFNNLKYELKDSKQVICDEQLADLTSQMLQVDNSSKARNDDFLAASEAPFSSQANINVLSPHWLVYEETKTPAYIDEAKKRLNIIKQPHMVPESINRQVKISDEPTQVIEENENFSVNENYKRHWLTWPNPSTPDNVREIRGRLSDDRYKKIIQLKTIYKKPKSSFSSSDLTHCKENVIKYYLTFNHLFAFFTFRF